jgi:hypothetical protein
MEASRLLLFGIAVILVSGLYLVAVSAAGLVANPADELVWGLLLGLGIAGYGLYVGSDLRSQQTDG